MLEIVKQTEDFKVDNGIATDVIAHFPYPTYVKDGFTYISDPKPTGFIIQMNNYSAYLIELKKGACVSEESYVFNICDGFGPSDFVETKHKLEECKTADEAKVILDAVRMHSFTSVEGDVDIDGMTELFSFTTDSGPIAYWIGCDSVEKEADDDSNIRVYAAKASADYLAADYDGENRRIILHIRKGGEFSENSIAPTKSDVLYISALFSAIAKECSTFDDYGDVLKLRDDISEIIKMFDYDSYLSENYVDIVLPGGIPAEDKYCDTDDESTGKFEVAKVLAGEDDKPKDEEKAEDAQPKNARPANPENKYKDKKRALPHCQKDPERIIPDAEPVVERRPQRATNMWLTASLFDKTPEEIAVTPIHNYTGHRVRFIDNAVRGVDGRMVIPAEGPNVVLDLPPEGRLSSANTYIDLGYVQGVPVSDIAPVKISAIPKVDGIIIVSPIYFNDALRAGFDMTNLYTLNIKIQETGKNGKPEFYYVGLTKRF